MKHTKIVATISDKRCDTEFIRQLYDAGMNVVRLNTAHISTESALTMIQNVRSVSDEIGILVDTKGALVIGRKDMNIYKQAIAALSNRSKKTGSLAEVIQGADVVIGVSGPGVIKPEMVKTMAKDAIVFAMANPVPEKFELPDKYISGIILKALKQAEKKKTSGKAVTPFLLDAIYKMTSGKSIETNVALVKNNAEVCAKLSCCYFNKI